jgi:adenine phosphoribosyltransferase
MLEILKKSFKGFPIVKRGEYSYFIHPISDGVPSLEPELLQEIAEFIAERADMDVDKILTIEAMGIPLATTLSLLNDIPFGILRKESTIGGRCSFLRIQVFLR